MFLHLCVSLQGTGTYVRRDIPVDTCTCYCAVCACGHIPVGVPAHVLTQVFVLTHMSRDIEMPVERWGPRLLCMTPARPGRVLDLAPHPSTCGDAKLLSKCLCAQHPVMAAVLTGDSWP